MCVCMRVCVCEFECVYVGLCVCVFGHTNMHTNVCLGTQTCTQMCVCVCVCLCVGVCVFVVVGGGGGGRCVRGCGWWRVVWDLECGEPLPFRQRVPFSWPSLHVGRQPRQSDPGEEPYSV